MNNLQESILDAMKVFVKDSTSKLNFPLTLECEVIRCIDENKGEYEVKYLENNFLAYCQYKGFKYNPNDVVYVLIPRGDFSKTKVILGLERDELIESDLTDIEPNPAEAPSADLDTIKIGDTVYNIAGTQPTEDIVKDVKVNGSSVVDNEKVANITVPTDTVTTTQMNNAINNATRDLVSETEMNSAIGEAISDLATETYVDNAVSPKANISDVNTALSYKADKSELVGLATETYVDNAVASKANTSDVNTALALKANSADVTSALALKADKTELIDVEANPSDSGTEDLTKLKVGNTVYDIPSGGGGTEVEANPSDPATDDLTTIKIGNTVYDIPGSGGGGSGQSYTCDVLFDTPTTISTWGNPIEICTEATAKEYDMLYVVSSTYSGEPMVETILVDVIGYSSNHEYVATPRTDSNVDDVEGFVFLSFDSGKLKFYTGTGHSSTLVKVYGLKFASNVVNNNYLSGYYSTEERVVGRWTDGKPLYQKTIDCGLLPDGNSININTPNNIENLIYVNGYAYSTNDATQQRPVPLSGGGTNDIRVDLYGGVIRIVTFSNWSSYHAIITIQYTKTTDTPGTGPTPGNLIYLPALYSEEEREVGVWTDGKPIYQKTFTKVFGSSNQQETITTFTNGEDLHYATGYIETLNSNTRTVIPYNNSSNYCLIRQLNNDLVSIRDSAGSWYGYTYKVTIQYTKTTDQPGSGTWTPEGQLAHHYSTSEKVVGTWIDGSTVYERSWDFGTSGEMEFGPDTWVNTTISRSNINCIVKVDAISNSGVYWGFVSANCDSGSYIQLYHSRPGNKTVKVRYLTLQYTKSV